MQNFDHYLRTLDIEIIKNRIQNEWDAIPDDESDEHISIEPQELLSSFLDIIKLYLVQDESENSKPDSLVNFFLSYVYLKFECVNKGSLLAWKMIKQLALQSQKIQEFKLILFLLEQDNKRSFCSFYYRTRNIIIEFLEGYESDYLVLDSLNVSVDQWSEICRRIFQFHHDDIINKISKVIASDHQEQHSFDPSLKLDCGRFSQICLWIYFKQVNQLLEDQKKYENQSELRRLQREENRIPDGFYKWSRPLFKNNNFAENIKYQEAIKQNKSQKQQYPKQESHKIYNMSPPKPKKYMNGSLHHNNSDSKMNFTSPLYSPVKVNRASQIHQSVSLQQSPALADFSQVNSYSEIPRFQKDVSNHFKTSDFLSSRGVGDNSRGVKTKSQASPKKDPYISNLIFKKMQPVNNN